MTSLHRTTAPEIFGDPSLAPRKPRRDDTFEVTLDGLDERGLGRGRIGEYAVRLPRCLPGERVLAQVVKRRREHLDARVLERLAPSPFAVPPRCPHTRDCGGCRFQELDYGQQLVEKQRVAQRLLEPLEAWLPSPVPELVPSPREVHYRNKMDFTFGDVRWTEHEDDGRPVDFALGLHAPTRHDKVLDVARCAIAFEGADDLLASVRELALAADVPPWSTSRHEGVLRHLVLRKGFRTGECLVNVVTSPGAEEVVDRLASELLARHPELTTLVHNETARLASVAVGERERVLHGSGWIEERLAGRTFRISAESFFQTNTEAAEGLVREVATFFDDAGVGGTLWDVCCGTGAFALALSDRFERVHGCELSEAAVADAWRNAELGGVTNAEFRAADVRELAAQGASGWPAPDAVVFDPPRAGLPPDVVRAVADLRPRAVAHVACSLRSAARDLVPLLEAGYRCERIALHDLFPHTPHVEAVFGLVREDAS